MKRKNQREWDLFKKFPIGTKVHVSRKMVCDSGSPHGNTHERRWLVKAADFDAWVVGCKWLCDGVVVHSTGSDLDFEQGYLKVTRKTPVLLVRKFMFGKEISVPVDGVMRFALETYTLAEGKVLTVPAPLLRCDNGYVSEGLRKELRKAAEAMPRDAKGHWLKATV